MSGGFAATAGDFTMFQAPYFGDSASDYYFIQSGINLYYDWQNYFIFSVKNIYSDRFKKLKLKFLNNLMEK